MQTSIAREFENIKHATVESGGQIVDNSTVDNYDDSPDDEELEVFDNSERFGAPTTEF